MRNKLLKAFVLILVVSLTSIYCLSGITLPATDGGDGNETNGFNFNTEDIIKSLKQDMMNSINKDLLQNISDSKRTGPVNAIITLSRGSLVSEYNKLNGKLSLSDYLASAESKAIANKAIARQEKLANELLSEGLISPVKYHYTTITDGIYVTTTYENLKQICTYSGVDRVIISDTYLPSSAVENPVNVWDTGIFNSSDVDYTGKGTVVAILDTGCDYTHSAFTTHQVQGAYRDRDEVESIFSNTLAYKYDTSVEVREVYYGNITRDKIWYGYDYADKDPDNMPMASEHGTHVAGIIGGKDSVITGVAVDTQLAIMKVFSDYKEGAEDGDIMAALEDCVQLGVDAINMSLGTSCGYTIERDEEDLYKNEIYSNIEKAGISLVVAASNDYSSAYGSEFGNTNKVENPDSGTVGSPSTYNAALSVASINGNKDKYMWANGEREIFFLDAFNQNAKEFDFFEMLGVQEGVTDTYEYVTVPGVGSSVNYSALDVKGKIALVKRGDISFEEKVLFAANAGAVAIIIYNNVYGDIIMTVGNNPRIPVVSIGKDDGEYLASRSSGTMEFNGNNIAGPFMSDFSSWGPTPDLKLKPEITAHGGNIYSAVPGGGYDKLSGTSMAAPNMTGIVILIRQYVKDNYPNLSTTEVRDMVNELCMSTATIALDRYGNPYSPRKQGAGIADILKATTTKAYIYTVDDKGANSGKTKMEMGDDPARKGVYTKSFKLVNLDSGAVSYELGNYTMTESLSADKKYVAERAYMLNNSVEYSVTNGTISKGVVTVQGGQTAEITVTIKLSGADKAYINESFPNGMYVEGFVTLNNKDDNGVDLNVPFLAFYGDWSDAPIFDKDYYLVETEAHNNAIDDDDKIKADYYATTPLGMYYYDYILPLGTYLYNMSPDYEAIPATQEHAALSYFPWTINGIYAVYTGLLRGARELDIEIVDKTTGKVVWSDIQYNAYKSHANGATPMPYVSRIELDMMKMTGGIPDPYSIFGANNTEFEVRMKAHLDWDGGDRNVNDTYSFSFTIDYQAPTITDSRFYTKYNTLTKKTEYYVDLTVYDNHYAMSVRPVAGFYKTDTGGSIIVGDDGQSTLSFKSLSDNVIPVYQETRGSTSIVTVEITDYLDLIKDSITPNGICFYIDDYALNTNVCYIPFPEADATDLQFDIENVEIGIGQTLSLVDANAKYIVGVNREIDYNFLSWLTWESDDECVIVNNGVIEGVYPGSANVTFSSENGSKATIKVTVTDEIVSDPSNRDNSTLEEIGFSSYFTIFAFNSDIDYSRIGSSGDLNFFDGSPSISFYPSEMIKLYYYIKPFNLQENSDRYTLRWISSNPNVATVDDQGYVTAVAKGRCQIYLRITVGGRLSSLQARCDIEVKSEFIIENRTLIAYKGNGGRVVIPDDEGIIYIGSFAFSHYYLDNAREVDDKYDIDKKKDPIGANEKVTEVVIPDGVEDIQIYAFYGLLNLKKVEIASSTIKNIRQYAFANCKSLTDINLTEVDSILDYAFYGCEALTCYESGGIDLSNVSFIGKHAFDGCTSMTSINLKNLRRSGEEAFANCSSLVRVELGQYARIAEGMFKNTSIINELVVYSDVVPDNAFSGCKQLRSIRFVNDLTYLGEAAFYNCSALRNVTFEGACEVFGDGAFFGCTSLTSLTLPNCDMEWGTGLFQNCGINHLVFQKDSKVVKAGVGVFYSLTSLTIEFKNSSYYIENDIVYDSSAKKEIVFVSPSANLGDYVLPNSVERIADSAFSGNTTLRTFTAGNNLREIGFGALSFCTNLTTVTLPANIEVIIGGGAFEGSRKLTKVNNLDSAITIGGSAFYGTALTEVKLGDNVKIGEFAFEDIATLRTVEIGKNATIGEFAFAFLNNNSAITSLTIGENAVIGEASFMWCDTLTYVDLSNVAEIGPSAFEKCISLETVKLSNVTEIGEFAFAGCVSLKKAEDSASLTKIGDGAFYPFIQYGYDTSGQLTAYIAGIVPIASINLSNVTTIGEAAFMYTGLTEADLTKAEIIGTDAFYNCVNLSSVTFGDKLSIVGDYAFGGCRSLVIGKDDLQSVKEIGEGAFMATTLPITLNLANVEKIGDTAFAAASYNDGTEIIPATVEVDAPLLTEIGMLAFAGCSSLASINAPIVQTIGSAAFTGTALVDLELSDKFVGFDRNIYAGAMIGTSNFKGFYVMVNGAKSYNYENNTFLLDDGVLYTKLPNGYLELSVYPMGKTDTSYTVLENTVRIDYSAAADNPYLTKVTLPMTLKSIGNFAFAGCENLSVVVFRSYYAPTLEGTMFDVDFEITSDTIDDFDSERVGMLYKHDFYYHYYNEASFYYQNLFMYSNFVAGVTSKAASNITCVIPDSSEGYDSPLYKAYFNYSTTESAGKVRGRYVIDFIAAMEALPDTIDRFAVSQMEAAINAYNMLMAHRDEIIASDEAFINELIATYNRAVVAYHVDTVMHIIAKLYDMDATAYSYNALRSAFNAYNALTDEEKALVTNAGILDSKLADLEREMGQKVDFSKEFEEYDLSSHGNGNLALIISLSVVGGVLVIGAAVFVTLWLLKKKKNAAATDAKSQQTTSQDEGDKNE